MNLKLTLTKTQYEMIYRYAKIHHMSINEALINTIYDKAVDEMDLWYFTFEIEK
ncbi:MAG: hypothetical protein RR239_06570 [Oscillospiraceae bacterium]